MSFCRFIWPLLVQPFHELFWHRQDIAAPMPQQVKKPSCHCSCSLALIWDWEWVWEWCVYALFKLLEMEQCFDIMIPCDDFEINFLHNVFQTNKMISNVENYKWYFLSVTMKNGFIFCCEKVQLSLIRLFSVFLLFFFFLDDIQRKWLK